MAISGATRGEILWQPTEASAASSSSSSRRRRTTRRWTTRAGRGINELRTTLSPRHTPDEIVAVPAGEGSVRDPSAFDAFVQMAMKGSPA